MGDERLASFHNLAERVEQRWEPFQNRRLQHLRQGDRYGKAPERIAENIVSDLFTEVLDWDLGDINAQVDFADLLLTRLGIKHLVIETKRPGTLAFGSPGFRAALVQAHRYAAEQRVRAVAVSDGQVFYSEDVTTTGPRPRAYVELDGEPNPGSLWWLSMHGIYRARPDEELDACRPRSSPDDRAEPSHMGGDLVSEVLLHPKYRLPAECFAFVGNPADCRSWHLPYRMADGSVDTRRLPKAIQAVLTNYRGTIVKSVPEEAVPAVLRRLGQAARDLGKMPDQSPDTSPAYVRLAETLDQLGLANPMT